MGDCISCGSDIPKGSRFCPDCGSVLGEESDTQIGRRLSDVKDEISGAQDAIEKAKAQKLAQEKAERSTVSSYTAVSTQAQLLGDGYNCRLVVTSRMLVSGCTWGREIIH